MKKLTPKGQQQLLKDPTKHRSVQIKGQIAQLRERLEPVEPLTKDREYGLRAIFAAEIVDQEAELNQQYRSLRISGKGVTWYGATHTRQ